MGKYSITKKVPYSYEEAVEKAREALAKEGFGILTEIDVKATLKKKLDEDFRKYMILGACNPSYAIKALRAELEIGILMPCNVIVYENEGEEGATVSAMDPVVAMSVADNKDMCSLVSEVKEKLANALRTL